MRKTILFVSSVFPPEQVTSALLNYDIVKELSKKYRVIVLRPYPTRPLGTHFSQIDNHDNDFETILVESYTCPESRLIGRMKESISFSKKCVDYLRIHYSEIDFIFNGGWQLFGVYMIAKAAVRYNIPYLITVQDIYPESLLSVHHYPKNVQWLIKKMLIPLDRYYTMHSVKVRTISDEMADYMSQTRHLPRDHYVVMNNWQNDEDFDDMPKIEKESDHFIFTYVGSINVHSNVDLIIKAFHLASIPNSELRIYGGGNKKEQCLQLVKEMGVDNILFDTVSRDRVPAIQNEADVLVLALPKGNGGLCLPSKMTSYMLSGKPILASVDHQSAADRYVREADCGVTVVPDSVDALIEGFKIIGQLSYVELDRLGENSRAFAEKHLTRKSNLPKLIAIIDEQLET